MSEPAETISPQAFGAAARAHGLALDADEVPGALEGARRLARQVALLREANVEKGGANRE